MFNILSSIETIETRVYRMWTVQLNQYKVCSEGMYIYILHYIILYYTMLYYIILFYNICKDWTILRYIEIY